MKIYCFYNDLYEEIFKLFSQSLKEIDDDLELVPSKKDFTADDLSDKKTLKKPFSPDSSTVGHLKLDLILQGIKENPGENLIYSDVDIRFLSPFSSILKEDLKVKDLLGLMLKPANPHKMASSFLAFKATDKVQQLFESIKNDLREDPLLVLEESLNKNLLEKKLQFGILSASFASRLPRDISLDELFLFHGKLLSSRPLEKRAPSKLAQLKNLEKRHEHMLKRQGARPPTSKNPPTGGEDFILDFFDKGCPNSNGDPLNLDCAQIQNNFYLTITAPGCKSCARRRALKKYGQLILKAQQLDREAPGSEIKLEDLGEEK